MFEGLIRRHERRAREAFADSLSRAVAEVDQPLRRAAAAVPIDRQAVAEAAPLLLQLAARLRGAGPLSIEAMQLARALVTDGAGPLYSRSAHRSEYPPGTLSRCARAALVACDRRTAAPEPAELVRG
jgi:hypothetical protein